MYKEWDELLGNIKIHPNGDRFKYLCPPDKVKICVYVSFSGKQKYPYRQCHMYDDVESPLKTALFNKLVEKKLLKEFPKTYSLEKWAQRGIIFNSNFELKDIDYKLSPSIKWVNLSESSIDSFIKAVTDLNIKLDLPKYHFTYHTAVVFTDGSCWPNIKHKSCEKCKKELSHPPEKLYYEKSKYALGKERLYCKFHKSPDMIEYNEQPNNGAYALRFTKGYDKYEEYEHTQGTTNIRMEGRAIYRAMKYVNNDTQCTELVICTDSKFWIDMYSKYMPKWSDDDFTSHVNVDITQKYYNMYKKLSEKVTVRFQFVYSHDKKGWSKFEHDTLEYYLYKNNNYVDELAEYARDKKESWKGCKKDKS